MERSIAATPVKSPPKELLEQLVIGDNLTFKQIGDLLGYSVSRINFFVNQYGFRRRHLVDRDLTDERFGLLVAVRPGPDHKKHKSKTWFCRCDCGSERLITQGNLLSGNHRSCGCVRFKRGSSNKRWKGYQEISGTFWAHIQLSAKRKFLPFDISLKAAWELFEKQNRKCALSGMPIQFAVQSTRRNEQTASLDRIDSAKPYTLDNVQWVHKDVNIMKNVFEQSYFIQMCKRIAENNA